MKAVIPAAGSGTRLFPHTHTKPKPMIRLAGKPILGHILTNFRSSPVEEVVIVIGGPMQNQIAEYARDTFSMDFELSFVEQERPLGLGHSIYQAEELVRNDPIVIALGDMLFQNGYRTFLNRHEALGDVDGSLGLKRVDEHQHYGIAAVDNGRITTLVEKPSDPPSDLAISGVYIIENTPLLFDSLEYLIENSIRGLGGEYHLTDALNRMISEGAVFGSFEVSDWYDCGRPETLLEANRIMLELMDLEEVDRGSDTVIVDPVDIGDDVDLRGSIIGPYVSIDDGATVTDSIVRDSIVGRRSTLDETALSQSLLGDNSEVLGETYSVNIGDNSSISL